MKHIVHRNTKTIFESDNNLFCLLTMNPNPLHTNVEYAKQARHGKILVVGTLVFSLAVGLTVPEISFDCIANLEYGDILHLKPVFIGDTIRVESDLTWEQMRSGERVVQTWMSKVYNQENEVVLSFVRKILRKV